jgi:hypothetical protein
VLTGKYREGEPAPPGTRGHGSERFQRRFATPRKLATVRRLEAWAQDHEHTVGELAIAWLAARPARRSIPRSRLSPVYDPGVILRPRGRRPPDWACNTQLSRCGD